MRAWLTGSLIAGVIGCNAILGIPADVEILCESGDQCPRGFCGAQFQCDDRQWAIALGDDEDQVVHDVAWYDPDREGEQPGVLLLAGSFRGTLSLSPEQQLRSDGWDGYVLALGPTGDPVWVQHIEGPGEQHATTIAVGDEGAIFVAGQLGGDAQLGGESLSTSSDREDGFLARLDYEDGQLRWAERFGGTDVLTVEDLAVVGQSTAVVGTYQGPFRSGPPGAGDIGPVDAGYIVSFNGDGTNSVSSNFGATEGLRACCALVDPLTGALMVGGDFDGALSLGGGTLTSDVTPGYILILEDPGPEGSPVSLLGLGQPLDAFGTDSLSRLAIGMRTSSEPGVGVFRLVSDEVVEAVRAESAPDDARLVALTNDRQNATLALGWFRRSLEVVEGPTFEAEDQDLFVLTIDEQWRVPPGRSWAFGGPGEITPVGIEADDDGHVMLVGSFDGTMTLGNEEGEVTLHSRGGTDIFVAQLRL